MPSNRAIAGTVILAGGFLVLGLQVLQQIGGGVNVDLPVVGLPVALVAGLILASAPEGRSLRTRVALTVAAGVVLWLSSFAFLGRYGWGPSPGGWRGTLLGFMDTAFHLAFTAVFAGTWAGLIPLSRAQMPRLHPWPLIPAPAVWSLIVGLEIADDALGVVAHDAPVWAVLYATFALVGLAATVGLLLAGRHRPRDRVQGQQGTA